MISKYLSDKIKVLSFISIIMVVYIHMYYTESESMPGALAIEHLLGGGICLVAVPLFYIISGYLFFIKVPNGLRSIADKQRKRVRTLLIPYLIANTFTLIFYVALNLITDRIPALDAVVNFKVIGMLTDSGIWQSLYEIYYSPIAFQLWFVRDLMIVIVFAPILYFALRFFTANRIRMAILIFLEIAIYAYFRATLSAAIIWFTLGGAIGLSHNTTLTWGNKTLGLAALVAFIAVCLTNCFYNIPLVLYYSIPLGVYGIWHAYEIVSQNGNKQIGKGNTMAWLCSFTFFIYLIHEPFLNIFKKVPLLFSKSEFCIALSHLLIPVVFVIAICLLGSLFRKVLPRLYSIYTGGR